MESTKIQDTVRETFMIGKIEGLEIGDNKVSLWDMKGSLEISGAPARNKFKKKVDKTVRFNGQGFVSVNPEFFAPLDMEFAIRFSFKTSTGNGILLLMGDPVDLDFVSLELINKYVVYTFDLGDGSVSIESPSPLSLNEWHEVEIRRKDTFGELFVDGQKLGEVSTAGAYDKLSVSGNVYFGGFPGDPPYQAVKTIKHTGCIRDVTIGPDNVELITSNQVDLVEVEAGCFDKPSYLATFPAATPGYAHLTSQELDGQLEMSFMFKTSQSRGLVAYLIESPTKFNFVSLALFDGGITLTVFPGVTLSTGSSVKQVAYNDNEWHSVSVLLNQTYIQLIVDDYDIPPAISNPENVPTFTNPFNVFMGGIPDDETFVDRAAPTRAPFIGCVRDVLFKSSLTDFNNILSHTGIQMDTCVTSEQETTTVPSTSDSENEEEEEEGESNGSAVVEPEESWTLAPTSQPEDTSNFYGECKLPMVPERDMDIERNSGLRFGTTKSTYLMFDRQLKIRRSSDFHIEFKTTHPDGIIFYIANERNVDFISLFMKEGRLVYGFNCGSGAAYATSSRRYDDGAWHAVDFSRIGNKGTLKVDLVLEGEVESFGNTKNIEVESQFFLGNIKKDILKEDIVKKNLQKVTNGYVGCLRNLRLRGKAIARWKENFKSGVIPCSEKVEDGFFFGPAGGFIAAFKRFKVGLDFDITMQIKPRNISGVLLAIQGRRDYLALQMIDGTLTFTVDNGRGPITAVFKPESPFTFCDGKWHEIHGIALINRFFVECLH